MAISTDTRIASCWDAALSNFRAAKAAAAALKAHETGSIKDEVLALYDRAREDVFSIKPPTLGAVAQKLEIYWGERLFRQDVFGNEYRQKIVGDLRRIERMNAGVDEPDATGGLNVAKAADRWAVGDHETLLGLPALQVGQVIRKLEMLWADGGIDPIEDDEVADLILQDLRRFASSCEEASR
jgi:hypothetical protein